MLKHTLIAASIALALLSQGARAGEPVWDGNTIDMVSETLSPGVFAFYASAHGDHSYGNMYLPASTTIIQHANTRTYVDQHRGDDKAFMIQNFGKGRGIE